jgi:hypothetical protein
LSSRASGRGPTVIGLSAVFCSVLAVFLVILGSKDAEGAPFCSQGVLGTGVRFNLRRIMLTDRPYGVVLAVQQKIECQDRQEILTLIGRKLCPRVGYNP